MQHQNRITAQDQKRHEEKKRAAQKKVLQEEYKEALAAIKVALSAAKPLVEKGSNEDGVHDQEHFFEFQVHKRIGDYAWHPQLYNQLTHLFKGRHATRYERVVENPDLAKQQALVEREFERWARSLKNPDTPLSPRPDAKGRALFDEFQRRFLEDDQKTAEKVHLRCPLFQSLAKAHPKLKFYATARQVQQKDGATTTIPKTEIDEWQNAVRDELKYYEGTDADSYLQQDPSLVAHMMFELLPPAYRKYAWNHRDFKHSNLAAGEVIIPHDWPDWREKHILNVLRLAPQDSEVNLELRLRKVEQGSGQSQSRRRQVNSVGRGGDGGGRRGGRGGDGRGGRGRGGLRGTGRQPPWRGNQGGTPANRPELGKWLPKELNDWIYNSPGVLDGEKMIPGKRGTVSARYLCNDPKCMSMSGVVHEGKPVPQIGHLAEDCAHVQVTNPVFVKANQKGWLRDHHGLVEIQVRSVPKPTPAPAPAPEPAPAGPAIREDQAAAMLAKMEALTRDVAHLAVEGDHDASALSKETKAMITQASPVVLQVPMPSSRSCVSYDDQFRAHLLDSGAEVRGVCDLAYAKQAKAEGTLLSEKKENLIVQSAAKEGGSLQYVKTATIRNTFHGRPRTVEYVVCANFGARPLIGYPSMKERGEALLFKQRQWLMVDDDGVSVHVDLEEKPERAVGGSNRHAR